MTQTVKDGLIGGNNGQCENKTGWQTLQILIRLCSDDGLQCFDWAKKINQVSIIVPRHEKTNVLHMRKQRRRSASR